MDNLQSIRDIPATHITPTERAGYIARATAGEDVYAYGHDRLAIDGFLNVWDTDTRIAYGPRSTRWQVGIARHQGTLWTVTIVSPAGEQVTIHLDIAYPNHPQHVSDYQRYAARMILSLVNHCSAFGLDPLAQLEGSHH